MSTMQQLPGHLISCGGYHAAAVTCEGKVVCWGRGSCDQCTVPAELDSEVVVAVSCGGSHTSALTASGNVVCWGFNNGDGRDVPADVTHSGDVIAISSGYYDTCAVTRGGKVIHWGYDGTISQTRRAVPADLAALGSLGAGSCSSHTAAVTSNGVVICWGHNDSAQCDVPPGLPVVLSVATGGHHTVALTGDGAVVCWGRLEI
jgi:hypothetical protein